MQISLDDLAEKCPKCDGSGILPPAEPTGTGNDRVTAFPRRAECDACSGSGRVRLTEAGRTLSRFLEVLQKNPQLKWD